MTTTKHGHVLDAERNVSVPKGIGSFAVGFNNLKERDRTPLRSLSAQRRETQGMANQSMKEISTANLEIFGFSNWQCAIKKFGIFIRRFLLCLRLFVVVTIQAAICLKLQSEQSKYFQISNFNAYFLENMWSAQ